MRDAGFEELFADYAKAQPLVKRRGVHLGAEHLLLQVAVLCFRDHRVHQGIAHLEAAPVLEHRDAPDGAVREQAGSADRVIAFQGQEVQRVLVFRVEFQLRRNVLLGNEHRFTNTADVGVVLMPVGEAHMNLIHWRIPGFLV
ncbi:hypothetical protein D9M71_704730 [compost metagenome]